MILSRNRIATKLFAATVLLLSVAAPLSADEAADAEKLLTEKGLKKFSNNFVLEDESTLVKGLKDLQTLQRKVFQAGKDLVAAEGLEEQQKILINNMFQARSQIRQQLAGGNLNVDQQNQLILQLNELGDRIGVVQESEDVKNKIKEVRGKYNEVRESYVEQLLSLRNLSDKLTTGYENLEADPSVKTAIETVSKSGKKELALGPSAAMKAALKSLKTIEDKTLSETIKMRRDEASNLHYLSVTFDGKHTAELGLDTGASVISLPFKMAKEVGLEPGPSAETVRVQLADGSIVEGKAVTAPSVRVGKFTVENVMCVVMPAELTEASPLLGMSFLGNFSFKVNTGSDELIMTKVDSPADNPSPSKKKAAGKKKDAAN
jgi:clan AA aspartic protease (TIGR02281 family)